MIDTTTCSVKRASAMRFGRCAWTVQSTGEKVAVALVLNRADWLEELGYTIAEAIERAGQDWVAIIPRIARQLAEEEYDAARHQSPQALWPGSSHWRFWSCNARHAGRPRVLHWSMSPKSPKECCGCRAGSWTTASVSPWTGSIQPARNACKRSINPRRLYAAQTQETSQMADCRNSPAL